MNNDHAGFVRPSLKRTGPNRGAANFYRAAGAPGEAVAGVPIDSVEAAVVAAVRMGYRIAAAQIDRTERLAKRLRQAGDQAAGPGSDRQALDATEQLVFRAMMAALGWLEGVASDRSNPLKRFATAEYRILGSLFGLTPSEEPRVPPSRPPDDVSDQKPRSRSARSRYAASGPPPPLHIQPLIRHKGPTRRAVQVRHLELADSAAPGEYPVSFYSTRASARTIDGMLIVGDTGAPTLILTTPDDVRSGQWKGAICDDQDMQIGYIELAL
jgi:hypothetical protein